MTIIPVARGTSARPALAPSGRGGHRLGRAVLIVSFLAPGLLLFSVFVIYPVAQAMRLSLYNWNGLGRLANFSGLENFRKALADPVFLAAIRHTLFFMVLSVAVQLPVALGLALLVRRNILGRRIFRLIFFLPFVLSEVVAAQIWNFLYQPDVGGVDAVLTRVVPGFTAQDWLGNRTLVLWAIFVIATWKWVGFWMTLFITGLNQIPEDIEEAAVIDGASPMQILFRITLPMIAPTIRLTTYLAVLGSLQTFELVFVTTAGGPANASQTVATYMYNYGFRSFRLGFGNAIAVLLFLVCFAFSLVYQRFVFSRDFSSAED